MFRSGVIFSVSGPAVLLTVLLHPAIRQTADHWSAAKIPAPMVVAFSQVDSAGIRNVSTAFTPVHVASAQQISRSAITTPVQAAPAVSDRSSAKPVRTTRDGCERAISSLAGPEARRMVPGRCIA